MTPIDEPITVVASFGGKERIKPLRFRWGRRVITVKEITYRWTHLDGNKKLHFFSLTDGKTLYNISFDPVALYWRLQDVETEL